MTLWQLPVHTVDIVTSGRAESKLLVSLSATGAATSARLHGTTSPAALHTWNARAVGLVAMMMHGDNVAAGRARS